MDRMIAMYLRLSKADGSAVDGVSNSIISQRELIYKYISSKKDFIGYKVIEFCDDGYSGTNFDRPQVQKMLAAAENGYIQAIIVKDFSRFGRNSIEVGNYLEEIFPYIGLRFISINDNYDSDDFFGDTGGFEISIKNLLSQTYAQDASKKIKSNFETKARKGEFIPFKKIYGYTVTDDKKLIVDKKPAEVVKRIFEMKNAGKSFTKIALQLNSENILVPKLYFKYGLFTKRGDIKEVNLWSRGVLTSIINDERYTGKLIYGRYRSKKIRSNTYQRKPRNEWIIKENSHAAIISEELFQEVQSKKHIMRNINCDEVHNISLFNGKVICGNCGRNFRKISYVSDSLACITARLSENMYGCCNDILYERDIANIIIEILKIFTLSYSREHVIADDGMKKKNDAVKKINLELKSLYTKRATNNLKKEKLLQDLMDRKINDNTYIEKSGYFESIENVIEDKINELLAKKEEEEKENIKKENIAELYRDIGCIQDLTRKAVEKLINKIIINHDGKIEIIWNFEDVFSC